MKRNQFIIKSFAIILLLVFTQKVGVGLYLHNWLHTNNCQQSSPIGSNVTGYACSCVDDFSMPFAEPIAEIVSSVPVLHQSFISSYIQPVLTFSRIFNSLRAPPTFLSC